MDPRVKEVFPPETIAQIQNAIKQAEIEIKRLETAIDISFRAGVDVTQIRKELSAQKDNYRKLKAVFGS